MDFFGIRQFFVDWLVHEPSISTRTYRIKCFELYTGGEYSKREYSISYADNSSYTLSHPLDDVSFHFSSASSNTCCCWNTKENHIRDKHKQTNWNIYEDLGLVD